LIQRHFNKEQTPDRPGAVVVCNFMNILTKATVLVLNRNWQAINVRTPQEAFCMMATNVATRREIEFKDPSESLDTRHSSLATLHSE